MRRGVYTGLFGLGLLVALLAARWVQVPGYMDAEYYYAGGLRLAHGEGLTQPFLWNYLDDPQGLPHPSHTYWMPLASLLAWLGLALDPVGGFSAAQCGFLALTAVLPPLTAWLGLRLTGQPRIAVLAGLLAVFPGFYLPYLVTTETFGAYMLLGGLIVALSDARTQQRFALLGALAGGMHLARADGLLWVLGVLALAAWQGWRERTRGQGWLLIVAKLALAAFGGYSLVMGWWYARNWLLFGALMPPGGARTLWLAAYDQTFAYPAEALTPQAWLAEGVGAALRVRLGALWQNLLTLLGVQGAVGFLPLMLAGLWALRKDRRVVFALLMALATLAFMSFVFPFAGARGGYLHSGAALQLLLWVACAAGFDAFVRLGVRLRNWNAVRAWKMFAPALVIVMAALSAGLYLTRITGVDAAQPLWSKGAREAQALEAALLKFGAQPSDVVMVNNPVGYFVANGRPAIVVPDGGVETSLEVARRYGARYLALEENHVRAMQHLYAAPQSVPGLTYLGAAGDMRTGFAQIYRIAEGSSQTP